MIKDFLIISCTGKNNLLGLKIDNNFFIKRIQTNISNNDMLVNNILDLISENNVKVENSFSILINIGPGSFSAIRVALAVAKGIKISIGTSLYGFKDSDLGEFNLINIDNLIKKNLLENELIKPVYIS
jgi:tRNA A37 threonylcarbamoyladenosine modification protein TsaB|tara:strand:+ start:1688 stop:2071 length:384 start_codon:yes stop_codon:yes gene_type:complete